MVWFLGVFLGFVELILGLGGGSIAPDPNAGRFKRWRYRQKARVSAFLMQGRHDASMKYLDEITEITRNIETHHSQMKRAEILLISLEEEEEHDILHDVNSRDSEEQEKPKNEFKEGAIEVLQNDHHVVEKLKKIIPNLDRCIGYIHEIQASIDGGRHYNNPDGIADISSQAQEAYEAALELLREIREIIRDLRRSHGMLGKITSQIKLKDSTRKALKAEDKSLNKISGESKKLQGLILKHAYKYRDFAKIMLNISIKETRNENSS